MQKYSLIIITLFLMGCPIRKESYPINYEKVDVLPKIKVKKSISLSNIDAITRSEKLAKSLEKYGLIWSWSENKILFKVESGIGSGIKGELILEGNEVTISILEISDSILFFKLFLIEKIQNKLGIAFDN